MKLKNIILIFFVFGLSFSYSQDSLVSLVIPNVFTPNNDGINDVFSIPSTGYKAVTCNIYNRHGGLVYRFFGLKGNWDGHTHAGESCVDGVYFIVVKATKPDGSTIIINGTVQLVR